MAHLDPLRDQLFCKLMAQRLDHKSALNFPGRIDGLELFPDGEECRAGKPDVRQFAVLEELIDSPRFGYDRHFLRVAAGHGLFASLFATDAHT